MIVGSGLLANCDKGAPPAKTSDVAVKRDGGSSDATPSAARIMALLDAAPEAVQIMAAPPPPRIHAVTPEKLGRTRVPTPQPPRIQRKH